MYVPWDGCIFLSKEYGEGIVCGVDHTHCEFSATFKNYKKMGVVKLKWIKIVRILGVGKKKKWG